MTEAEQQSSITENEAKETKKYHSPFREREEILQKWRKKF